LRVCPKNSTAESTERNANGAEAATYRRSLLEENFNAPFYQILLYLRKLESDGRGFRARIRGKAVLREALISRYFKAESASCSELAPVRIQRDLKVGKPGLKGVDATSFPSSSVVAEPSQGAQSS
jgi:hypothetical protein